MQSQCSLPDERDTIQKIQEFLLHKETDAALTLMQNLSLKELTEDELTTEVLYWIGKIQSIDPNCIFNEPL